jgi:hypothetical protein
MKWIAGVILVLLVPAMSAYAGEADVVQVQVVKTGLKCFIAQVRVMLGWAYLCMGSYKDLLLPSFVRHFRSY